MVSLNSLIGGLAGTPSFVAFGAATTGATVLGATIDLGSTILNYSFSMPRDGTITAMNSTFKITAGLSLGVGALTVKAQLYKAARGTTVFSPIPSAVLVLDPPVPTIAIGTVLSGAVSGLSIPVVMGDQLLLVYSCQNSSILSLAESVTGAVSAGVCIN